MILCNRSESASEIEFLTSLQCLLIENLCSRVFSIRESFAEIDIKGP